MTLETALRALSEAEARVQHVETRVHELEGERQRLALRVKDLEQQLGARAAPLAAKPVPNLLTWRRDRLRDTWFTQDWPELKTLARLTLSDTSYDDLTPLYMREADAIASTRGIITLESLVS